MQMRAGSGRRFGGRFHNGFRNFFGTKDLADCTIVIAGRECAAHMLLLCYHSEFFRTALSPDFREGKSKHIDIQFEDPAGEAPPVSCSIGWTLQ